MKLTIIDHFSYYSMLQEALQNKLSFHSFASNQLLELVQTDDNTTEELELNTIQLSSFFKFYLSQFVSFTKHLGSKLEIQSVATIDAFQFVPELFITTLNIILSYFFNSIHFGEPIVALLNQTSESIIVEIGTKNPLIYSKSLLTLVEFTKSKFTSSHVKTHLFQLLVCEKLLKAYGASISCVLSNDGQHNIQLTFPLTKQVASKHYPIFNHKSTFIHFTELSANDNQIKNRELLPLSPTSINPIALPLFDGTSEQVVLQKKVMEFVYRNLGKSFNIQELADYLHISQPTLFRKWKEIDGMSLNDYITKIRLEKVIELVKSQQYSFSQAAYFCGFHNSSYFSRIFKKFFLTSPSVYFKKSK